MNILRFITGCTLGAACFVNAHAGGGAGEPKGRLHGEVAAEVNYGRRLDGSGFNEWDFPHLTLVAGLDMGRGWTLTAEFEYERLREDGEWCNDHRANFATNKFYVNKQWSECLGMKLGIVDVPLGVTNAGGPALTIYDPLSEAALMPMTWHEAGVSVGGTLAGGRADYTVAALAYGSLPLDDSRAVGMAATVGWRPVADMRLGLGGFFGNTMRGMLRYSQPDIISAHTLSYGVADACYEHGGLTASGSFVYCTDGDVRSVGAEAGYDVLSASGGGRWGLVPFVRYDGVFHTGGGDVNKFTAGLNVTLPYDFIIKAEYGRCASASETVNTLDVSVGYALAF